MASNNSTYITPRELESGLINGTIDKLALEQLLTNYIHENENIDTLVQFFLEYIPGNRTMDEFLREIREYNSSQICGLVWNANIIAYRCKTCSISPCMSICAQCFQHGNHEGHNYNMFKSQAGGACDCGDSSVMHSFGFCRFHGENRPETRVVPRELICCAELLIPHLLKAFIRALRMSTVSGDIVTEQKLLEILNQLSNGGSALQIYITNALTDRNLYEEFTTDPSMDRLYHLEFLKEEYSQLPMAFFVPALISDAASNSLIAFDTSLRTMLDEIMMWCVVAHLPEDLVRFLLGLLPDFNFKLLFTETFLRFYGIIAQSLVDESLLETSEIPSRLVHISVQLFSSNVIAEYAMEKCHLIEVILSCIWYMFVPSTELEKPDDDDDENLLKMHPLTSSTDESNTGMVVDVEHRLIVKNVYWPLLSDFVNILSQEKITLTILENKKYLNLWLRFLTLFQGVNVNERILTQHVEYEPQAYMYAFTIELEISAAAMWSFVNHLKPNYSSEKLIDVIKQIVESINDWLISLNFNFDNNDQWKLTFHLPLHRYLSVFAYNAIYKYNINPGLYLPIDNQYNLLNLMFHTLRTFAGYYEVLSNIWLRNGQQVMIQAKTYAKSTFSSSMHDADIFLLQLISCYMESNVFVENLLKKFHVYSWLFDLKNPSNLDPSQLASMLESALIALCAIAGFHPNIAVRETKQIRREIISTLAVADRLYSEVEENVPDPSPLTANRKEIETILAEVSDFQTPSVELLGHLQQGKYVIKGPLFQTEYDPLHVIMRCTKRAHFQNSLERFTNYVKHEGLFKSDYPMWPPFRLPTYDHPQMSNVRQILRSGVLHRFIFLCLNAYLKDKSVTENILYFTIYLLELSLVNADDTSPMTVDDKSEEILAFKTNNIFVNIRTPSPLPNENENESILTLLLKILHKQRSNDYLDLINNLSVQLKTANLNNSSRIGDGYHFISNIFNLSSQKNEQCRLVIEQEIEKLKLQHQQRQPTSTKTSDLTAEQKRQRAKNRQQKLLAEIAQSQKKFISQQNPDEHSMLVGTPPSLTNDSNFSLEQTMTTAGGAAAAATNISIPMEDYHDYECCVCRLTKSDSQSPIGLIGTSCLSLLPSLKFTQLDEDEQRILAVNSDRITLETYLGLTKQCLTQISGHPYIANYCENNHHLRSLLIQSCGHSMHVDCLSSYLRALHPNQAISDLTINNVLPLNTSFRCPLCRQSANALIPLFDANDYTIIQPNRLDSPPFERLYQSMLSPKRPQLKRDTDQNCLLGFLQGLETRCVPTEQISPDIPISIPNHEAIKQRSAEFDCGILRAQLVHEQLFYESANRNDQKTIRKSYYKIIHDLHHLGYPFHHQHLWQELTGFPCPSTTTDVFDARQPLPPILLRDSITMLLQLLMSAPHNLPLDEFDTIVQIVFNVEFFKSLISIILEQSVEYQDLINLNIDADLLIKSIKDSGINEQMLSKKSIDGSIESYMMRNCLEFFKITSLIKYRLYSKEMPWMTGEEPSPLALANFLNLTLNLNGLAIPKWYCDKPLELLTNWLQDFRVTGQRCNLPTKILCLKRPYFHPPLFVNLPAKYDDVFHLYNDYHCEYCKKVSSDTLLCLICGQLHIKRWHLGCCDQQRQRYNQHLIKCGHPAAVMLDIQTTLIAICLTDSYGYWHSLYLDQHGEEDPKLKRGKSLHLNTKRLDVLRTLWLTARFEYHIQNWFPYNSLMISHFDVLL